MLHIFTTYIFITSIKTICDQSSYESACKSAFRQKKIPANFYNNNEFYIDDVNKSYSSNKILPEQVH